MKENMKQNKKILQRYVHHFAETKAEKQWQWHRHHIWKIQTAYTHMSSRLRTDLICNWFNWRWIFLFFLFPYHFFACSLPKLFAYSCFCVQCKYLCMPFISKINCYWKIESKRKQKNIQQNIKGFKKCLKLGGLVRSWRSDRTNTKKEERNNIQIANATRFVYSKDEC